MSYQEPDTLKRRIYLVLFAFIITFITIAAEDAPFEEISLFLNVAGVGGTEIDALIKDDEAYLSVTNVFDFLKIKNKTSSELGSVSGFFIDQQNIYVIDKSRNQIIIGGKTYILSPNDLIQTPSSLYLKSTVYGKIFSLNCVFNFRSLSITLNTKLDLPVTRERRQELMRNNISKLNKEITADTTVKRRYTFFNFGAVDWSVISSQQQGINNTRLNLKMGTVLAGGETNFSLNYDSQQEFKLNQQNYQWRYVNNENKVVRQVLAGKIGTQSVSSLVSPVLGIQITNTPTAYRRSFGTYTISDFTEPDWVVELYVNNVLLNYVKADASGFYTFQVPMVYGNSVVKLRFFGPWGEERIEEQNISVPYNFLPKKETEYTLSAGIMEDGRQTSFSRADFKYGLNNSITIGGGAEYLSSHISAKVIPFASASFRITSNLMISTDYAYGVRAKGVLNYRLPSNLLVELSYFNYKKGQTVINQSFLEERKLTISKPYRTNSFSGFSRLTLNQILYANIKQTLASYVLSATTKGISGNLTTYALLAGDNYYNIYSNLAMAFRLPSRFTIRPQMQFGYKNMQTNQVRLEFEKQLFGRGFLNLSYENNLNNRTQSFGMGLRFDLSFARASVFARQTSNRTVFTQSLSGGAINDSKTNYFNMNNRSNVGRGGLVISSFLDINANNRRDANEPKIEGLKLKINGGRVRINLRDTIVQVVDLEPYTNYLLELDPNSFDNIAWQLKKATYKVSIEPNKLKLIEVSVKVSGEASGMIFSGRADSSGQGRIIVNFYRNDSTFVGRTLSESDGYFTFLGFTPGSYRACIDSLQLMKLKMEALPASIPFNIVATQDGDIVSDIDFKLRESIYNAPNIIENPGLVLAAETIKSSNANSYNERLSGKASLEKVTKATDRLSSDRISKTITAKSEDRIIGVEKKITIINASGFSIRTSALGDSARALIAQNYLFKEYGHPVTIFSEGRGSYQLNILGFENKADAEALLPLLTQKGFKGLYIIPPRLRNSIKDIKLTGSSKSTPVDSMYRPVDDGALLHSKDRSVTKIATEADGLKPRGLTASDITDKEHIVNFLIVIGKAGTVTNIKQQQELIYKILSKSSFVMQSDKLYQLVITGFSNKKTAEEAFQKLVKNGLKDGYIQPYKIKSTRLVPVK